MYCKYCGKPADDDALKAGPVQCTNCGAIIDITDGGQSFFTDLELDEWRTEGSLSGPVDTTLPDVPKTHVPNLKSRKRGRGFEFEIPEGDEWQNNRHRGGRSISTRLLAFIIALAVILLLCVGMVIRHNIHKHDTKDDLNEMTPTAPASDSADLTEPSSEPAPAEDPNADVGETGTESVIETPEDSWETVYCNDPVNQTSSIRVYQNNNGELFVSANDVLLKMGYMEKEELINPDNREKWGDIGFCNQNYESAALPYAFAFRPETGYMWVRTAPFDTIPPGKGEWGSKIDLKGTIILGEKQEVFVPAESFILSEYINGKYITDKTSGGEYITIKLKKTGNAI